MGTEQWFWEWFALSWGLATPENTVNIMGATASCLKAGDSEPWEIILGKRNLEINLKIGETSG